MLYSIMRVTTHHPDAPDTEFEELAFEANLVDCAMHSIMDYTSVEIFISESLNP